MQLSLKQENSIMNTFNAGLCSDAYKLISFKLGMMIDIG